MQAIHVRNLGNLFFWIGRHMALVARRNTASANWIRDQFLVYGGVS